MRAHDWAPTPFGPIEQWPQRLRTLLGLMLHSRQPTVVAWGPERTPLHNGCIPVLGRRHPDALGRPFLDVWHGLSDDIGPILDRASAGEAVRHEDLPLTLDRKGCAETTHFTLSHTPVRDKRGAVAGMFCACTEPRDGCCSPAAEPSAWRWKADCGRYGRRRPRLGGRAVLAGVHQPNPGGVAWDGGGWRRCIRKAPRAPYAAE